MFKLLLWTWTNNPDAEPDVSEHISALIFPVHMPATSEVEWPPDKKPELEG